MCLDSFSLVWPFFSGNVPWNFRCFIFFHALRCFLLCLCYSNLMYFIHEVKHELVCGAFVQLFHNPVAFCLRKDKFVPEDTSCCCCLCATNIFVVRQTSQLRPSSCLHRRNECVWGTISEELNGNFPRCLCGRSV